MLACITANFKQRKNGKDCSWFLVKSFLLQKKQKHQWTNPFFLDLSIDVFAFFNSAPHHLVH